MLYLGKTIHNEAFKKIYMFFFDHWTVFSTLIQFIHELAPRSLWFPNYSISIVDAKSGRFMYQSRRAGDKAKRRKSPAKSGRVGITVVTSLSHLDTFCTRCQNGGKQWKFIRRRVQNRMKVCILLNVFLATHFRFMSSLHLLLVLFDAIDKPPGFSPNLPYYIK